MRPLQGLFNKAEVKKRIIKEQSNGAILPLFNLASFIAFNALIKQTCKSNDAYGHHLINVSKHNTDSENKMIIGMLHDVIEDSDWDLDDLRDVGFSERIIKGIDGVTHRSSEKYFDSIERCSLNNDSIDVKLNDNRHNLDASRYNWLPTDKDFERQKKYIIARLYLIDIKKGFIQPGMAITEWIKTQKNELQDWNLISKHSSQASRPENKTEIKRQHS